MSKEKISAEKKENIMKLIKSGEPIVIQNSFNYDLSDNDKIIRIKMCLKYNYTKLLAKAVEQDHVHLHPDTVRAIFEVFIESEFIYFSEYLLKNKKLSIQLTKHQHDALVEKLVKVALKKPSKPDDFKKRVLKTVHLKESFYTKQIQVFQNQGIYIDPNKRKTNKL